MATRSIDRLTLPIIVGLTTVVLALILLQRLVKNQKAEIEAGTKAQAVFVKNKIESVLKERILPLEILGERWRVIGPPEPTEMNSDAALVMAGFPNYQSIQWVDPTLKVRWVAPQQGDPSDLGADLSADLVRRRALQASEDSGQVIVTRSVALRDGGRGFLVCVPAHPETRTGGFLLGVFRYQDLLDSILQDVAADYWVAIRDGEESIYARPGASLPNKGDAAAQEQTVKFHQLSWKVRVWPKPEHLEAVRSILPQVTFVGGILMAAWLATAVYMAESSRFHAQKLSAANKELEREIVSREQAEEALRQAQKMEAVGRLAGGVAHDFNNMLMVIRGHAALSLKSFRQDGPLHRALNEILNTTDRASSMTRQLLALSRKQVLQPRVLDLNALLTQVAGMLPPVLGEDIQLEMDLDPRLGHVKADAAQLEQVIMNLVFNSRDAMPEGGRLYIRTANSEVDETWSARHPSIRPGPHVMLAVRDTGHGMDLETQSHVFEPFFTTKDRDRGTGLGLATVYGTVSQSGGCVTVSSRMGAGTTIQIFLPRVDAPIEVTEAPRPQPSSVEGHETILVVEDDDAVRRMALEFLTMHGYAVREANSAAAAIQLLERAEAPINLVLTDVVMPGMKGRELGDRLAKLRPGIKVLYMSAYSEDAAVNFGILSPDNAFIEKPFSPEELARKVREVLGAE